MVLEPTGLEKNHLVFSPLIREAFHRCIDPFDQTICKIKLRMLKGRQRKNRCDVRMKAKRARLMVEEKEEMNRRKREAYHRKNYIDNYTVANALSREDVLKLINSNERLYHKT